MKRILFACLMMAVLAGASLAEEARLLRYPDIHQDKIVFVYGGDLWLVSSEGGVARRLTTHPGIESSPKFSPDGKYIAFSGFYDGNTDIFVIPAEGGVPKRLTYHPLADRIIDWYPDSKHILFRSGRESFSYRYNKLFKVSIDGGYPEALPLPEGELSSLNADASRIAYNRMAREERTWKRYRGGMAQDIWVYDFAHNTIENITDNPATDSFPMWQGDTIYFLSDRDDNVKLNLYAYNIASKAVNKLTNYGKNDYDVKWPSQGPGAIVYQHGGWLYVLDLTSGQSHKVNIEIYSDHLLSRPTLKNVSPYIQNGDISPTGKRAIFEARGEIFTVPAEKGDIRNLTNSQGVRERWPVWSPDGKWIAYVSDRSGDFQIYILKADGKGEEKQLTKDLKTQFRNLRWSPDSKKILFSAVTNTLYYIDIEGNEPVKIDFQNYAGSASYMDGRWSPDSKWVTYSKPDFNRRQSIWLYSLDEKKNTRVTGMLTDDFGPAFDPDGKYLYWIANREFNHGFDGFDFDYFHYNTSKVVLTTLQADTPNPFAPESDEETVKEEKAEEAKDKKDDSKKSDDKKEEKKDEKKEEGLKIDLEGLESRLVNLPIPAGNYFDIQPSKGFVFFASVAVDPSENGAMLHVFDMKKRKLDTVLPKIGGYTLSADGKKIGYVWRGSYGIVNAAPNQKPGDGRLNLSEMQMIIDYRAEWRQIYYDAWRMFRDMFYDPNMHGIDWEGMKKRYEVMLPYIAHRDDLNYVIGELIGELNTGHTYRRGGEYPNLERVNVGTLGCDFKPDDASGYYQITKIYQGQSWEAQRRSPLVQPGISVKEGDYLIAINGQELKYPDNPYRHLVNTVGKSVALKVNTEPKADGAKEISVQPISNDGMLRYIDWVMGNVEKVNKASNGRIGYIHIPDTQFGGWEWFNRLFMMQAGKEALIVDGRYNSGGFDPVVMLERLTRKLSGIWVSRYSEAGWTPFMAVFGPKVMLTNHWAGSGGDNLPFTFRTFGLGPIIGTRTWGGLVGYNPGAINSLVDNGTVAIPMVAFVNPQGEFDVENKGVTPDIVVDNLPPDTIDGHDTQLEAGIDYLLKALAEQPNPIPKAPTKYPVR